MSKSPILSAIQKQVTTQNTFKRNKKHYDAYEHINRQKYYSMRRRKPNGTSPQHVQHLMRSSFQSSKIELDQKVRKDIEKYKFRVSVSQLQTSKKTSSTKFDNLSQYKYDSQTFQSNLSSPTSKIKGVPLASITSRDYFHKRQNKIVQDQRLFNNFEIEEPDLSHTFEMKKQLKRDIDFTLKHINDLNYNTQKIYDQNNFQRTVNSCKFDYVKEKITPRYFFVSKRKEDQFANDLEPQRVQQAFMQATPFTDFKAYPFYANSGRQIPCQIQLRQMSHNRDYWHGKDGKQELTRPSLEFNIAKVRQGLKAKQLQSLQNRKKPKMSKSELCDVRYFRMYPKVQIDKNFKLDAEFYHKKIQQNDNPQVNQ